MKRKVIAGIRAADYTRSPIRGVLSISGAGLIDEGRLSLQGSPTRAMSVRARSVIIEAGAL